MSTYKRVIWLSLALVAVTLLAACVAPTPEVREVEVIREVEVPVERPHIRVAYPSIVDMEDIPSVMAHQLLVEQGYAVTPTFYAQSELAVEALARGDADFGNGADRTFWAAISKGANIVTIMEQAANGWAIFAIPDIQTCEDLGGRRFAQHSEGAVSKAMSDAYILENCPGTEPEILIIPGSENRAAALLAGEIDASPVELADAVQIELQRPGEFHVLANFAVDVPKLKTTALYVNGDFAAEHPEAVKDYIRALLTVHRQIVKDPDSLIAEASKWLAIDPEVLPKVVEAQFAANSWDVNGGLDEDSIQFSIDFFTNAGRLDPGLTVDDVADLSYLNEVLDEIGRQ
ncbi:MAG: ABC transporter substrate-binding protein [Anaerolineae bacterium]